jgi:intraflagellar transport protein 52
MLSDKTPRVSTSRTQGEQLNIAFSIAKKELFTPSNGFKSLQKRLRSSFKITLYKDEMSASKLIDAKLLVLGGPCQKFSSVEFAALKTYLDQGGNILYLANEGGESSCETNFNYFLEEFGMSVNSGVLIDQIVCLGACFTSTTTPKKFM